MSKNYTQHRGMAYDGESPSPQQLLDIQKIQKQQQQNNSKSVLNNKINQTKSKQ